MSEPSNETNASTSSGGQKKSKKLYIIIGLVVVLLAGGGGGYYFISKSSVSAAENKSDKKKKSAVKESETDGEDEAKTDEKGGKDEKGASTKETLKAALPDDSEVKQVVELQPFIINLADSEEARYLRLSVSLGIGGGGDEKPSPLFMTRVKNAMLAVLSVKKSEDVLSVEGKTKLRKELLQAAQAASEEPKVEAIYITDFIVQL